jgi:hypothetical protein
MSTPTHSRRNFASTGRPLHARFSQRQCVQGIAVSVYSKCEYPLGPFLQEHMMGSRCAAPQNGSTECKLLVGWPMAAGRRGRTGGVSWLSATRPATLVWSSSAQLAHPSQREAAVFEPSLSPSSLLLHPLTITSTILETASRTHSI